MSGKVDQGARPRFVPRAESGAVAVEFALVLPVLLLLVFGIVQYGFYFWSMQGGSAAVRDAARRGAVGDLTSCGEFRSYVMTQVGAVADEIDAGDITRTYATASGASVSSADLQPGDVVTVTVEFQSFDFGLPFVPFIDDARVTQVADARVDYVATLTAPPETCT